MPAPVVIPIRDSMIDNGNLYREEEYGLTHVPRRSRISQVSVPRRRVVPSSRACARAPRFCTSRRGRVHAVLMKFDTGAPGILAILDFMVLAVRSQLMVP